MAAYAKYAGKVPPISMQVLAYMALVSVDSDRQPWYGQGHHAIAEHALGRTAPITDADIRAVERALAPLAKVGAIRTDRKAAVRRDGPNTARYRLNLDLTGSDAHAPRIPSDVPASSVPSGSTTIEHGDPPRPTESVADAPRNPAARPTECGTDAPRNPWDRGVRGTTRSDKTEEESDDLRTAVTVAREDSTAPTPELSPQRSHPQPRPARCSHGLSAGLRIDGSPICAFCRRALPASDPPPTEPDPEPPSPGGHGPPDDGGWTTTALDTTPGPDEGHRPQLRLIRGAA
jgi:hypothetical protein